MQQFQKDTIYIDSREPDNVRKVVRDYFKEKDYKAKITRLDVGDFYFNGILIERKDCVDFVQSIYDARLNNQRNNMIRMAKEGKIHPYVIIEGTYYQCRKAMKKVPSLKPVKKNTWISSVCHLLETGIGVYMTDNRSKYKEIGIIIQRLSKYFNEDKPLHDVFIEPEGYSWDMKAYQCFEGVGYTTAKDLADKISIFELLQLSYKQQVNILTSVDRIGEKRADKIIRQLRGGSIDEVRGVVI